METTISLSLPPEQLALLNEINKQLQIINEQASAVAWLTDETVSKRLHISVSTLRRWRTEHQLPFMQIGEVRLYSPKEVDNWISGFSPSVIRLQMEKNMRKQA